ncbi:MAG: hypothetical protein HZB33_05915 [Nitrospirae bacterium]|nr:hypothetical protein [Nitrospirota bacterium]
MKKATYSKRTYLLRPVAMTVVFHNCPEKVNNYRVKRKWKKGAVYVTMDMWYPFLLTLDKSNSFE